MRSRHSIRYFPFAPGIPWKLSGGKVIPEVSIDLLHKITQNKKAIIVAYGGFIESFVSLVLLEMLNRELPKLSLVWEGDPEYYELIRLQGLSTIGLGVITNDEVKRFPVPLFLDKEDGVYFNCLNNYLIKKSLFYKKSYKNKQSLPQQIIGNGLLKWNNSLFPRFRNLDFKNDNNFVIWSKINKFNLNRLFVLLFPDSSRFSIHNKKCLSWNIYQVRSFVALMKQYNISTVIVSNDKSKYLYSGASIVPFRWDFVLGLMHEACAVLSEDIDFLMVANMISNAKIFSCSQSGAFNLHRNNRFLANKNVIYTKRELVPVNVAELLLDINKD